MNRNSKFTQSMTYPPNYHNPINMGGAPDYIPPQPSNFPNQIGMGGASDYLPPNQIGMGGASDYLPPQPLQQSPQQPPHNYVRSNHSANQQRDHPESLGSPEQPAQFPETLPLYNLSKNVLKRIRSCWVELGKKDCGVCRTSIDNVSERDKESNENTPSSIETNRTSLTKTSSPEGCGKENVDMWSERLEDYNFLSGVPSNEKRYTSIFGREKSSSTQTRRHSIAEWRFWPKNNSEGYRCAACKQVVHKSCLSKVDKCHGCALTAPICPIPKNRGPQIVPDPRFGPTIPQPPQDHSITNDYWNLQVTEYPWWVERMSRIDSTALLISTTEGTFLLRWSDNHNQPILSLKAMGEVKHMRVNRQDETGYFFLSEARFFRSIVELINYHYANLLAESFQGLERTLTRPVYDTAVVRFTYSAPPSGNNHLSMLQGERVVVISRDGEARGWWKGRIGTRVGYFPKEYVTLDNEPFM